MPYRADDGSWAEPFADARELAAQPASSFAGRLPTVQHIVSRLDAALGAALIAAEERGDDTLRALVVEMRSVQQDLVAKVAAAWKEPDLVVRVHAPAPTPPPAPVPQEPAERSLEALARVTRRGVQLRTAEMFVFERRARASLLFLEDTVEGSRPYAPSDRTSIVQALERLEHAYEKSRAQLVRATARPEPCAAHLEEALVPLWDAVAREVARMGAAVAAAREFLATH